MRPCNRGPDSVNVSLAKIHLRKARPELYETIDEAKDGKKRILNGRQDNDLGVTRRASREGQIKGKNQMQHF